MTKRIALIHAVRVAIDPVEQAFQQLWPEAERVNLLDDALSVDRAKSAAMTPAIRDRILRLAHYARDIGADGILFTCSAFGEPIEAAARALPVPVLKPNEAMFELALEKGSNIGMLATFERSVASMQEEFEAMTGGRARLTVIAVPAAMTALQKGDAETHNALLAEVAPSLADCDAILLAQFSTSIAFNAVQERVRAPVLTSPGSAVAKLRRVMGA